jgi:hypothetical protein
MACAMTNAERPWTRLLAVESAESCPECSAPVEGGRDCAARLGGVLAWEAHNAELAGVHFLTVASYNLQHPAQFEPAALEGLWHAFAEHLNRGLPVSEIRRRMGDAYEGTRRVLRPEVERRPVQRAWSLTIAYVYPSSGPERASARTRDWASAVRDEFATGPPSGGAPAPRSGRRSRRSS